MTKRFRCGLALGLLMLLGACSQEPSQNLTPLDLTPETLGHYCQMNLLEHPGPKAQVFLEGNPAPLFFSQVRDAIAYSRAPEQTAPIVALFVNDMGKAGASWETPGKGNWIAADGAFYVLGSNRKGGMGAPEAVPFARRDQAEAFAASEGGQVLALKDVKDDMVLTPVEAAAAPEAEDADFSRRLKALPHAQGD